mmetsp:Transcript_19149/g.54411  ORF Transcript_19149/g.54411 Transcript_19149/m.54411 type:complete len:422 (-) Transcript_19149:757-2022(-)
MEKEHTEHPDVDVQFETPNYGVRTTSRCEWEFVISASGTWAKEDEALCPNDKTRKPVDLETILKRMEAHNMQLQGLSQPKLIDEEVIGGRLYTGPLFVKYNAVLRGLQSKDPHLRREFIRMCALKETFDKYVEESEREPQKMLMEQIFECCKVERAWEDALKLSNKYASTIHAINSCIVKASKLTKACKVYRGMSDKGLPTEFYKENEFGVAGGVEPGFMSTTTNREVAMSYSKGKVGIVFEMQMGMVDRGADIAWLSQYPHEKEILFGPLTGLEMLSSHVDGPVVVLDIKLSANLKALTLEKVVSKRRELIHQMAENMAEELGRQEGAPGGTHAAFLTMLDETRSPAWYNEDSNLKEALAELVEDRQWFERQFFSTMRPCFPTTPGDELSVKSGDVNGRRAKCLSKLTTVKVRELHLRSR